MLQKRKASSVSLGINKTMTAHLQNDALIETLKPSEYTIKVANTLEERKAVFHLGYETYLEKGYIKKNSNEWLIQSYDFFDETLILIVQDSQKKIVGSVTIIFNETNKLPAEKVYNTELSELKNAGNKIAEISRLVIALNYRHSKEILVLLFDYLSIYTYQIKNYDYLAIEVNPRHKDYYKTLLGFAEIGDVKPCPQVQNAPAVLLFLSKTRFKQEKRRCLNLDCTKTKNRTLYPYFLKAEQEILVGHYLEKQAKPISAEEKIYFGFTESNINRVVCY